MKNRTLLKTLQALYLLYGTADYEPCAKCVGDNKLLAEAL